MTERDLTELVFNYLDGSMSPDAEKAFEKELETNAELRKELEFGKLVQQAEIRIVRRELAESSEQAQYMKAINGIWENKLPGWGKKNYRLLLFILLLSFAGGFLIWYFLLKTGIQEPLPLTLVYGEVITRNIERRGEARLYSLSGDRGDSLFITVQGGGFNPQLDFFDPNGDLVPLIFQQIDDTTYLFKAFLEVSGVFSFNLKGEENGSGSFRLWMEKVNPKPAVAYREPPLDEDNRSDSVITPPSSSRNLGLLVLAEEYLNKYLDDDFSFEQIMGSSVQDTLLSQAQNAFEAKNWAMAISLYESMDSLFWINSAYSKLGVAYLQTGNTERAIEIFRTVKKDTPLKKYRYLARWYLLLAYLDGGEKYTTEFEEGMKEALENYKNDPEKRSRFLDLETRLNSR